MRSRPGVPLRERAGPTTGTPPDPGPGEGTGVEPPPGTACWVTHVPPGTAGVFLGWQQIDGQWHALVSAWVPRGAVEPRTQ
jgi:hypothetical protein